MAKSCSKSGHRSKESKVVKRGTQKTLPATLVAVSPTKRIIRNHTNFILKVSLLRSLQLVDSCKLMATFSASITILFSANTDGTRCTEGRAPRQFLHECVLSELGLHTSRPKRFSRCEREILRGKKLANTCKLNVQ